MAKEQTESKNAVARGLGWFGDSWAELKKVHHPTRQETISLTLRVFGMIFMFGVFLGLTDWGVGTVMKWILT